VLSHVLQFRFLFHTLRLTAPPLHCRTRYSGSSVKLLAALLAWASNYGIRPADLVRIAVTITGHRTSLLPPQAASRRSDLASFQAAVCTKWEEQDRKKGPWAMLWSKKGGIAASVRAAENAKTSEEFEKSICLTLALLATWCQCLPEKVMWGDPSVAASAEAACRSKGEGGVREAIWVMQQQEPAPTEVTLDSVPNSDGALGAAVACLDMDGSSDDFFWEAT
jgi:hypothetical protein